MGNLAEISNDQGFNHGMIFVLFLLLIIVTSTLYVIQPVEESFSGTANPGFYITNNTSNIRFNVTFLTDSASPPTPSSILIPNGGEHQIELSGRLSLRKTLRGSVGYNAVLSNGYISIGNLSFTLEQTLTQVGYDTYLFSSITGISSTVPVRWRSASNRLTILDA